MAGKVLCGTDGTNAYQHFSAGSIGTPGTGRPSFSIALGPADAGTQLSYKQLLEHWSTPPTAKPQRTAHQQEAMTTRMPRALSFVACVSVAAALTLTTRSRVPNSTPKELQQFLATPANWPRIVLSSVGVEGAAPASPLRPGSEIDELFGLPPVLPLRVKWRCEAAGGNTLDVRSEGGLEGVATDCRMDFSIEADGDASVVDLAMSYEPASPLAVLAAPVLIVDNWLALNVLLPRAFSGSPLVRQKDVPGLAFFALLSTWHFGVGPAIREAVLDWRG